MHREPGRAKPRPKSIHGHTGPATLAEDHAREADPATIPASDRAKIAEAASREEDA